MDAACVSFGRTRVERHAPDLWRVWPADETWLRLLASGALVDDAARAAVIKEHPQHEGVLLRGPLAGLLASAGSLRARLLALPRAFPLVLPDFTTAILLRRAVMTRPVCLAATSVAFTNAVDCVELESQAAHRIGQLAFRAEPSQLRAHEAVALEVPPGEEALARHLRLPQGVRLAPDLHHVRLGVRAAPGGDAPATVALVRLEPGSVRASGHAKFMAVTSPSYWPLWKLARRDAEAEGRLGGLGLRVSADGVVSGGARREFLLQQGLELLALPAGVELDFECLSFDTKEAVLEDACARLVSEVDEVAAQLDQAVLAGASACPDVPSAVRGGDTA